MIQVIVNNYMGSYLQDQFKLKEKETYRIFNYYSTEIYKYFMNVQGSSPKNAGGAFYTNRSFDLVKSFYAQALARKGELVIRYGYDGSATNSKEEEYAPYLEKMQEGRFATLPKITDRFVDMLISDLKRLYGDDS